MVSFTLQSREMTSAKITLPTLGPDDTEIVAPDPKWLKHAAGSKNVIGTLPQLIWELY